MTMVTTGPAWNSSVPAAWVATSTGNFGAIERLAGDETLAPRPRSDAGDAAYRPEQVDEVGDVVGRHVEHRAAAGQVVEGRIRMPALVAGAHEEGGAAERNADGAFVDELAAGLMSAAEKGVGRAADPHAAGGCRLDQLARLGDGDAERLLGMDMLAGGDRLQPDLDMRLRDGQVDDDLDGRVGEKIGDAFGGEAELGGARLGDRLIHVGEGAHLQDGKDARCLEIGRADIAAADDADADRIHVPPPRGRTVPSPRRVSKRDGGYHDVKPPSARTIEPVRRLAASEARKWTTEAISSGLPRRPIGVSRSQSFIMSSTPSTEWTSGVSI